MSPKKAETREKRKKEEEKCITQNTYVITSNRTSFSLYIYIYIYIYISICRSTFLLLLFFPTSFVFLFFFPLLFFPNPHLLLFISQASLVLCAPWPSLSFFQSDSFFSLLASVDHMDLDLCICTSNTWEEDIENGTIVALLAAFKHFGTCCWTAYIAQVKWKDFERLNKVVDEVYISQFFHHFLCMRIMHYFFYNFCFSFFPFFNSK